MSILHRLLFTKDGELDLGWLILAVCVPFGMLAFALDAAGVWHVSVAAWTWYGSFTTLAFIAGATISRARLIAASRTPGEVARGIAASPAERFAPHAWATGDPEAGVL